MAEVENISNWTTKQVLNWFEGLDDSLQCYISNLGEACLTGAQLLAVNHDDLNNLGITLIGHQELVLEGVQLLKQLHFGLDAENLQSHALDLNCKCRELRSSISSRRHSEDENGGVGGEALKRGSSIPLLRLAVDVLDCAKHLILWLDRPPFLNRNDTRCIRASIVKLSYELSTTMQQTVFACVIEEAALSVCKEVEQAMNQLIVSSDPLTIQPCSLEVAHMVNSDSSSSLGLFIKATFEGHLVITGTKEGSISSRIRRISAGDDVVAVGGQTVIGWQLSKLVAALKNSPKDITLTLKKRPTLSNTSASATAVRRAQPERILTVAPAISPIRKVPSSSRSSLVDIEEPQPKLRPQNVLPKKAAAKQKKKARRKAIYPHVEPKNMPSRGPEPRSSSSQRNSLNSFGSSHDGSLLSSSSCEANLLASPDHSYQRSKRGLHKSMVNIGEFQKQDSSDGWKESEVNELKKTMAHSKLPSQTRSKSERRAGGYVVGPNRTSSPLELLTIPSPPTSPYTPRSEGLMSSSFNAVACPAHETKLSSSESPNSFMDCEQRRRFTVIGSEEMNDHWRETLLMEINSKKSIQTQNRPSPFVLERLDEGAISEVIALSACNSFSNKEVTMRLRGKNTNFKRPLSVPANYYSPIRVCSQQREALPVAHVDDRGVKKLAPLNYSFREAEKQQPRNESNYQAILNSDYSPSSKDVEIRQPSSRGNHLPAFNGNNSNNCPVSVKHPIKHQTSHSVTPQKPRNKTDVLKELSKFWERKRNGSMNNPGRDQSGSHFDILPSQSQMNASKTHFSSNIPDHSRAAARTFSKPEQHVPIKRPIPRPRSKTKNSASPNNEHLDGKDKQGIPPQGKVVVSKPGLEPNDAKPTWSRNSPSRESYIAAIDVGYALEKLQKSSNPDMNSRKDDAPQMPESYGVKVVGGVPVRMRKVSSKPHKNLKNKSQVGAIQDQGLSPDMRSQRRISCRDLGQGECNGWLWKKKTNNNSPLSSGWTKRWVVLKEGALYCYRTEDDEKAESYIELAGYKVMPAPENKRKCAFRVVHPQRKTFFFASDRQSDMSRWMNKMGLTAIEFVFPPDVEQQQENGDSNGNEQYYSESESEDAFNPSGISSDQSSITLGHEINFSMSSSSQSQATDLKEISRSSKPNITERNPARRHVSAQSALNKGARVGVAGDSLPTCPVDLPDTDNVDRGRLKKEGVRSSVKVKVKNDAVNTKPPKFASKHDAADYNGLKSAPRILPNASPGKKATVAADQRKHNQEDVLRSPQKIPSSWSLESESLGNSEKGFQDSRSAMESKHVKSVFSEKVDKYAPGPSTDPETNVRPEIKDSALSFESHTTMSDTNQIVTRRDMEGCPKLRVEAGECRQSEGKLDSSIDDLCKALQNAEVDIHGVKRRVTLRRKMTILSRDPRKNELMLKKRALHRQLKALQQEVEYFDSLLDQENVSSENLHAWINEHPSLVANLGTIRRISRKEPGNFQGDYGEVDTLTPSTYALPSSSKSLASPKLDEQPVALHTAPDVQASPIEERSSRSLINVSDVAASDKNLKPVYKEQDHSHSGATGVASSAHRPRSSAFSSCEPLPFKPLRESSSRHCQSAVQEQPRIEKSLPPRRLYLETDL